jgi:hypothetical protein
MMYDKVEYPKKATQQWRDQAFAPIRDYLREHYADSEEMLRYLMFMGNSEGEFHYKNRMSRDRIIVDQQGKLVYCGTEALRYDFMEYKGTENHSFENLYIHPNVTRWMGQQLSRRQKQVHGDEVAIFLQVLLGPHTNYDYSELTAGNPIRAKGTKGMVYLCFGPNRERIVFCFGMDIDEEHYEWHNQMGIRGWKVILMAREAMERNLSLYQKVLFHAGQECSPMESRANL